MTPPLPFSDCQPLIHAGLGDGSRLFRWRGRGYGRTGPHIPLLVLYAIAAISPNP